MHMHDTYNNIILYYMTMHMHDTYNTMHYHNFFRNPKHQERPEFSSLLVCLEQMDIERWINWMQETYDRDKNVTIRYEDLQFKYSFGTSNN